MNKERSTFPIFVKAAFFMLSLLVALGILTSMTTGISLFNKEVMGLISTIYIMSLVILGVLALTVFLAAIFKGKSSAPARKSTLIRDNFLRYEGKDENGRKKKITVDISKIDDYLSQYSELYMVRNTRLHKEDKKGKSNANTLIVTMDNGSKISLRDLNNTDEQLYNEICAFLDRISDKDSIDLSFRMRKYAAEEDMILSGRDTVAKLKDAAKRVKDKEIKAMLKQMCEVIIEFEDNIADNADRVRKLYDHYLPMLVQIVENYIVVEGHNKNIVDISGAKQRLYDTLILLKDAFISMEKGEESESFDQLDADASQVSALLEKREVRNMEK